MSTLDGTATDVMMMMDVRSHWHACVLYELKSRYACVLYESNGRHTTLRRVQRYPAGVSFALIVSLFRLIVSLQILGPPSLNIMHQIGRPSVLSTQQIGTRPLLLHLSMEAVKY